jgi:riboflavin kinase/FMN adenylyltransferase
LEALGIIDEIREIDHGARLGLQETSSSRERNRGIRRSNCRGWGKIGAIPPESNLSESEKAVILGSVFTIDSVAEVPDRVQGGYVAVGNFDGVHCGHRLLIARLKARADALSVSAVVLTFDPHPVVLLRPQEARLPLVSTERKVKLLTESGADVVGIFATGPWLLGLTAREFFETLLVGRFKVRGIVEGPNFTFGHDRGGNGALLARWCHAAGLAYEELEPMKIDDQFVSSSRIRRSLGEGRAGDAARLLGRPHRVRGRVSAGAGRGTSLGFPTANLEALDTLIPGDGVYAVQAYVDGLDRPRPAACHIGPNATFGERARTVEVHLLDFEGDLYGRMLEIDFIQRLRATRTFACTDDLLEQIHADVARAREACKVS